MINQTKLPFWHQPESRRLEFKEAWPSGDGIARTAVAFANGAGGKIVFGVREEPREIVGISDAELFALEEKAANHIFDLCHPTIVPEIYIQNAEGKNLLVVEIYPGYQKPYYLKKFGKHKGTIIRVGSVNRVAGEETLISLERARRNISYDEVVNYELPADEIDLSRFTQDYETTTGRQLNTAQLKNLGLLVAERGSHYPTNAAILLSESPQRARIFPYAKIECARFKGTSTKVFLDQASIEGPLHSTIEPCIAFIKRNIALGSKIGEVYREDRWEYPLEAVREAVTNAVVHRDYAVSGSDIKVAIFDDMLEITSPGPLPDTLPIDTLGSGRSEIRNRVLAPIFKDLGLIEAWGTGIQKMREEASHYPNIDLRIHEADYAFQVQFVYTEAQEAHEAHDEAHDLSNVDRKILEACTSGEKNSEELLHALGYKERTGNFKKSVSRLLELNLIEMTIPDKPRSKNQKYRLTKKGAFIAKRNK